MANMIIDGIRADFDQEKYPAGYQQRRYHVPTFAIIRPFHLRRLPYVYG